MDHFKIKKSSSLGSLISPQTLHSMNKILKSAPDGLMIFDFQGSPVAINEKACQFFGFSAEQLQKNSFWELIPLNSFTRRRHFLRVCDYFDQAKQGLSQAYTWSEYADEKPIISYNILINKGEIHGESFIFVQIVEGLAEKIIDWILLSLATIEHHSQIIDVIDKVVQLASNLFNAEYVAVCLIDSQQASHAVSYYHLREKKENIQYPFTEPVYTNLLKQNELTHSNQPQRQPITQNLFKKLNINSFLMGSIVNTDNNKVGSLNVMTREEIAPSKINFTLFSLLLKRVNLEIERLLDQRKLQFLASISQQNPNPILRLLPTGQVIFANDIGKSILKNWLTQHKSLPSELLQQIPQAQKNGEVINIELEVENKIYLFTIIWIEEFRQVNVYGTDISQLKLTEQKMLHLARYDALTQIPNRQYFEETLKQKFMIHKNEDFALLLIDLDNFKIVNDTLGHGFGDKLLKAATKRMIRSLRAKDFLARLGGDEFIVILEHVNPNSAFKIAEKMIELLAQDFSFGEHLINITASIGIAFNSKINLTSDDLLKHADIAMYEAKKFGKNTFALFSESFHHEQNRRNDLLKNDLKLALDRNEFFIEYQPVIDLIKHQVFAIEAFLRWQHPTEGLIYPNEFIPIAEQTDCIHLLGKWLIEQALGDYKALFAAPIHTKLMLNISLSQLNDVKLYTFLSKRLNSENIDKNNLSLNITENINAPNFQELVPWLEQISKEGIKLCLDNFNPESLLLLATLPINYLKLHSDFLKSIRENEKKRLLIKGIIQLASDLDIATIQKGVETKEQEELIKALSCCHAQGFYYSKSAKFSELLQFIEQF